jgi:Uncharacterized protein conserved in bacteria (DUF2188)
MKMARKPEVHTVPNPGGKGWVNEIAGEVVSTHRRKDTAVDRGRELAIDQHTEHSIHNLDGTIGRKNSYGNDPNPPKDKNR